MGTQGDLFDLIPGLKPADADVLAAFGREMTEHAIPEMMRAVERRRLLAAEARSRHLALPAHSRSPFPEVTMSRDRPPQVDLDDPARNIFGLLPCPECGSKYRWPTRPDHPTHPDVILCDQCGRTERKEDTSPPSAGLKA
jgi:hypothetical protein